MNAYIHISSRSIIVVCVILFIYSSMNLQGQPYGFEVVPNPEKQIISLFALSIFLYRKLGRLVLRAVPRAACDSFPASEKQSPLAAVHKYCRLSSIMHT
jgi:hypothetical protein